ncbi:MAG TPA: carbon-phosphorus lyase complex subunit PhnI [Bryobacteraceae bacterium]|nr:carbon-phosphorus lyase complex subunit PhnI [Bryobacteraceae bacterium]
MKSWVIPEEIHQYVGVLKYGSDGGMGNCSFPIGRQSMGYVAVKGGQDAIENANELVEYYRLKEQAEPVRLDQIKAQFRLAIDRAMGEGSLYAPEHAALAVLQTEGDSFEAAFHLRAYRATLKRRYYSEMLNTREMFVLRRISSTFREIPGGQILGPTRDYSLRLLNPALLQHTLGSIEQFLVRVRGSIDPAKLEGVRTFSKVVDLFVREGLMRPETGPGHNRRVFDVTREAIKFPVPRSAVLQMLARGETGGLMCMAYSTMRGFGVSHGTIGELRVGDVAVRLKDARGRVRYAGKIRVTECEMVGGEGRRSVPKAGKKKGAPYLSVGYGLCFGQNETKAICMGMLESGMRNPDPNSPANSQEFVLYHTECVEAYGFTNHLKLPHYVTFQSGLSNLRKVVQAMKKEPVGVTAGSASTSEGYDRE